MIPDSAFVQTHYDAHRRYGKPCCFEGLTYNKKLQWPSSNDNLMPYITRKVDDGESLGGITF